MVRQTIHCILLLFCSQLKLSNHDLVEIFIFCVNVQLCRVSEMGQGIINCKGTETFAKEPKLAKLLRELKPILVSYNKKCPLVFVACL